MKVLFIGGTGTISSACTRLALEQGVELYLFNRGQTSTDLPAGAHLLQGDINNHDEAEALLKGHTFDAVVDWIAFGVEQVERDIGLFSERTGQYVFISSASVYQKPVAHYRIDEGTPLANPFWKYSRKKIACEDRLMREYRDNGFPITIVRPSHTYTPSRLPTAVGSGPNIVARLRVGKKVIVHGDGGLDEMTLSGDTSVWEVAGGKVSNWTISVTDTGLPVTEIEAVRGGDKAANAKTMRELLPGAGGPVRDYVLLNSAGVLLVGDLVSNIRDGVQLAAQTIDSGAAKDRMESMIEVSQAGAG